MIIEEISKVARKFFPVISTQLANLHLSFQCNKHDFAKSGAIGCHR